MSTNVVWSGPITITVTQAGPQKISYQATLSADKTSGTAPLPVRFTVTITFPVEVNIQSDGTAYLEINGQQISWRIATLYSANNRTYDRTWIAVLYDYTFNQPGSYSVRAGIVITRIVDAQGNQYVVGYETIWSGYLPVEVKGLEVADYLAGLVTGVLVVPALTMGIQKLKEYAKKLPRYRVEVKRT